MGCFCGLVCGRQGLVDGAELVALHLAQDHGAGERPRQRDWTTWPKNMGSYGETGEFSQGSPTWELMEEKQDILV